jgi:hypothetical protein
MLCQWEPVIEFFPFGLMDQDDDVEESIEEFSQHEFADKVKS